MTRVYVRIRYGIGGAYLVGASGDSYMIGVAGCLKETNHVNQQTGVISGTYQVEVTSNTYQIGVTNGAY
ncbi:hypothetical protein GOBAR_AA32923 [Gossypium barbadense]|uniref:Uncharacterized protein n=1 Tax=Gossypium barbadense TaxID=3634 RepID=A0A2P5W9K0_GOSBA|nr:hypothetical protein GOBAR_AA32923 [Gossypium barbadense]